jgi:acyl-coenzyme A synthetase/AMP-(fatty) acid ligase/3-hydroxymyristoyl/3-hydroxydecanoyl-(acyl carrier protein) dehydratase
MTLLSLMELAVVDRAADSPVAIRQGAPLSRAAFLAGVHAWRSTLASRQGDTWALYFRDSFDFACGLVGAWHAGKTVLLPGDTQPATTAQLADRVDGFVGEFDVPASLRVPESLPGPAPSLSRLHAEHVGLAVFTSGSTGAPVAIPKTFRQLDTEAGALQSIFGDVVGRATVLSTVPHHHFYGLLFKVLWPLCRGAPFLSEMLRYPEEVARRAAAGASVWVASPVLLQRLDPHPDWEPARRHLRAVFSAGGPLLLQAASRCAAVFGRPIQELYGSSETGAAAWRCRTSEELPWRPLPGVSLSVMPGAGTLTVRSPWVDDGGGQTADRAEVQADGTFWLRGRADRIVKIGEERISLTGLEARLAASALLQEARGLVLADGRVGLAAVLSPAGRALARRAGKRVLVEELTAWTRSHIAPVALPRRWRFVEALPQNALGKVVDAAVDALFTRPDPMRRLPPVLEERRDAQRATLCLGIAADLPFFEGHFPAAPILPGVAQIEWAGVFAREIFGLPAAFRALEAVKFQKIIRPGSTVTLTLDLLRDDKVAYRYESASGQHSSGRILFGA